VLDVLAAPGIEMYGTCMEINDKSMEIDEICSKWEMIHTGNE
jgi:hypothetical protein